jgi:hypothetical protein
MVDGEVVVRFFEIDFSREGMMGEQAQSIVDLKN